MSEQEEKIKAGNLKLTCFESFPYEELKKICDWFQSQGYKVTWCDNGNIVMQKVEE
jgi:competence CoiA-like predicted nuclease